MIAVSTMLGKEGPYKNVSTLAHVLDKNGKKMSKSAGDAVDPWSMIEKYGADSLRWHFYTMNQPGDYKRFDEAELQKTYRKFISTFANILIFYKTYSSGKVLKKPTSKNYLDKWIVSRLNSLMASTAKTLDSYDITAAAMNIESITIEDLAN